jgi:hypothetical protein
MDERISIVLSGKNLLLIALDTIEVVSRDISTGRLEVYHFKHVVLR